MGTTNFDTIQVSEAIVNGQALSTLVDDIAAIEGLSAAERSGLEAFIANLPVAAVFAAPAAEAADARSVAIQLNDHAGTALAARAIVTIVVSTDATGDAPGDGSATVTVTAGTDGAVIGTDESGTVMVSEVDGDIDIILTDGADAAQTVYAHVVANGKVIGSSAAIAFADDTP